MDDQFEEKLLELKKKLRKEGKKYNAYAAEMGLDLATVYKIMRGESRGNFGKGHETAVKMGLK